jgi:hypothetical protein
VELGGEFEKLECSNAYSDAERLREVGGLVAPFLFFNFAGGLLVELIGAWIQIGFSRQSL